MKSDSIDNLVKASDVRTKKDIDRLQKQGYLIGFTFDNLKEAFPEQMADNLYYNNGLNKTYYFDKDKNILFPVYLYGEASIKPYNELAEDVIKQAKGLELEIQHGNYFPILMVLNDKMRMQILNLLIEQDKLGDPYHLFNSFYPTSDYGCSELSIETMRKLKDRKTDEQIKETFEHIKDFPDKLIIYRGEGDKSTEWQKSVSWTTDINVANFFASRMESKEARIYIAEADKKDIIEFFDTESECIILPENIRIKDQIQIKGTDYLEKKLPEVTAQYHSYRDLITDCVDFNMEGVHGESHSARVLLNCILIANEMNLSEHEIEILGVAAAFHDSMRDNDGDDTKHGEASAKYYRKYAQEHPEQIKYEKVVEQIIKYHCLPDEIGKYEISKKNWKLFDIFKDADALDRVRFGIRDLDINQLRTPESKSMTMVADILRQEVKIPEQSMSQGMEMT